VIHQNVAHDACSDGEEVGSRLPLDVLLADKPEIGLVDECSGLKSVVLALPTHVGAREPMKLTVDKGEELLESRLVPLAPVREELRNFTLG